MMYYNSNKTNSDYYNTYKQEMATIDDYSEGFSFQKIIKIGFTILMIGLLSILTIYLVNYFSTERKEMRITQKNIEKMQEELNKITSIKEIELPKSIQIEEREKERTISPEDVERIVTIIMKQIENQKKNQLEEALILAEKPQVSSTPLEESNHYNKVVITNIDSKDIIDRQIELRANMDTLLKETTHIPSGYEQAIKEEINTRSNEMRIIIVKKGDTLSKIAKKAYGDFDAYTKILTANPEIVKNPNEIFVGQKLRIPA